jgi:hypothetical protein
MRMSLEEIFLHVTTEELAASPGAADAAPAAAEVVHE